MTGKIDWESLVGRRIKLRDLHILFAVVQSGSMAKAARGLGVSQPAVSEAVADLERALGVRLLDRHSHGVEPTIFGAALLKRSTAVFDELKQSVKDIEFLSDPTRGEVSVGCTDAVAATILPAIIHRFSQAYPHIVVYVNELPAPARRNNGLRERKNDLVLGRWVMPTPREAIDDDLDVEVLFNERIVVAAGTRSRWMGRRKIELPELIDEPWVLSPSNTWNYIGTAEAFRTFGLAMPRPRVIAASILLRAQMVATNQYISVFFKDSQLQPLINNYPLKVLPVELCAEPQPMVILTLKNRILSPVAEKFVEHVRAFVEPHQATDAGVSPPVARAGGVGG